MHLMSYRAALAALLLLTPALIGCGGQPTAPAAPAPPVVTVATPVKRTIVDQDEYVGRFVAVDSVECARACPAISTTVAFQGWADGQAGRPAFHHRQASVPEHARPGPRQSGNGASPIWHSRKPTSSAAAQLVRDKTITEQIFEQRVAGPAQCRRPPSAAAEAVVRQAELDLEFTELRAPVGGRIGDRRVTPGNLVTGGAGGNTTLLATIVSSDPIRLEFTFDEASLLRYERLAREGKDLTGRDRQQPGAGSSSSTSKSFAYRAHGLRRQRDRARTGTIRGRAQFANADGLFTPGMFGRVQVPGSPPYEALLVPDAAIGTEQVRKFVYRRRRRRRREADLCDARPDGRRPARDQGRPVARRPRRRQWPDARAPG